MWITRAEPGASRTADALAACGFAAIIAPLLEIRRLDPPAPDLEGLDALAFTSRNGVDAFAALSGERHLPVFTVGEATARAAREAGFRAVQSADGALSDLAALLAGTVAAQAKILLPGARETVGDLAEMLHGRLSVRALPVYEATETGIRLPVEFDTVLLHSPRAGRALSKMLGTGGGRDRIAVAISAAAAAALQPCGFTRIAIAARPTEESVLEALGKIAPAV